MDDRENIGIATAPQLHIRKTKYSSTLLLSFITSLGICCAVFTILPSNRCHGCGDSSHADMAEDIVYATIRFTISIILLFFGTFAVWIVRNRAKFHKNQEVYWPFECRHCAMAAGLVFNPSGRQSQEVLRGQISVSSDCLDRPEDHDETPTNDSTINTTYATNNHAGEDSVHFVALKTHVEGPADNSQCSNNGLHEPLYRRPHKSLLRVGNVFGILVLCNLPIQMLSIVVCLAFTDGTVLTTVTLFSKFLFDLSILTAMLSSLFFFNTYYEAVFIEVPKFSYAFGLFFATCLWMLNMKISLPVARILNVHYDPLEHHCEMDHRFMKFISDHDERLTPFYAECCIVFAATIWQMWSSILPRSYVIAESTTFLSDYPHAMQNESFCRKVHVCFRKLCVRTNLSRLEGSEERLSLSGNQDNRSRKMHCIRNISVPLLLTFSVIYCAGHVILSWSSLDFSPYSVTYMRWFLEITYSLPLIGLLHYQSFIMNRSKTIPVKPGISALHGLLVGHDRLLLLSCGGIFAISIFRLIGAIQMFGRFSSVGTEDIVLASYAAIYSIFRIYLFWFMTSFILIVQRQVIQSVTEAKVAMKCLLYVVALNAINWLLSIADVNSWIELQSYYGPTLGRIVGALMEPFVSLYGLHAAIVAYETFQTVSSHVKKNEFVSTRI